MTQEIKFTITGTQETGSYVGLACTAAQLGYRDIGGGRYRVRLEPNSPEAAAELAKVFTGELGWKQPGDNGQDRFSKVINTTAEPLQPFMDWLVISVLNLGGTVHDTSTGDYAAPDWLLQLANSAEHTRLVGEVRNLKLPGSNAAGKWKLETLRAKVAAASQAS